MTRNCLFILFILFATTVFSQVLRGRVTDINGKPISAVTVTILNKETATNASGNYQLKAEYGKQVITFSARGFDQRADTVNIAEETVILNVSLEEIATNLEELIITNKGRRDRGKEIMQQVIDKRSYFADQLAKYSCSTYCFTSLETEDRERADSLGKDTILPKLITNIAEWNGISYVKGKNYKDVIMGSFDLDDSTNINTDNASVSVSVTFDAPLELGTGQAPPTNPYLFVNGTADADLNLFQNLITAPKLTQNPLVSPMAYNAFIYYRFFLESSSIATDGRKIYEIRVEPRFREEALFEGTLFIRDSLWELVSYDLTINKGALSYFKEMRIACKYEKVSTRLIPTQKEFTYAIKDGRDNISGTTRLRHSNYAFDFDDSGRKFWLETTVYVPQALDRDTSYWDTIRPFKLKDKELIFLHQQDSILKYHASEPYLKRQDSIYNSLNVWSFLFNGIGFRNTFKKQEIYISPLIEQVIPFGVGGYRHRLSGSYEKEFKNGERLSFRPEIDYGFNNKDLKGSLGIGYMYNPLRFSRIDVEGGDMYDFINNYQSFQGSFSPANRVRNRKIALNHTYEVVNGLYLRTGIFYSNRSSIDNIEFPNWVNVFGFFSKPQPFEGYKIFMSEIELSYHFRQKYMLRYDRKLIIGSEWPVLSLEYKKGIPKLFGGQSDFDFLEVRLTDEIHLNTLGNSELRLTSGTFLRKKDLRIIEHKYFRTSDKLFFSNPVYSLQLLDTALNTSNSYFQFNYIHHFNGFFLNKVWLLNRLKLQETVGGSMLLIPDAHFAQAELYVGLERMFRIRKQLFKIGMYAITYGSSFDKSNVEFKIGVNFYNAFYKKWDY